MLQLTSLLRWWHWILPPSHLQSQLLMRVFKVLHPFHSYFVSRFCLPALSSIFHSKNSIVPQFSAPLSSVRLHHNSSLYRTSLLLCGCLQTQYVCHTLCPVSGEHGVLGVEVHPTGFFGPDSVSYTHLTLPTSVYV